MDQDNRDIEQEQEMEETSPTDIDAASTSDDPSDEGYVAPEEEEGDGRLHTVTGSLTTHRT